MGSGSHPKCYSLSGRVRPCGRPHPISYSWHPERYNSHPIRYNSHPISYSWTRKPLKNSLDSTLEHKNIYEHKNTSAEPVDKPDPRRQDQPYHHNGEEEKPRRLARGARQTTRADLTPQKGWNGLRRNQGDRQTEVSCPGEPSESSPFLRLSPMTISKSRNLEVL